MIHLQILSVVRLDTVIDRLPRRDQLFAHVLGFGYRQGQHFAPPRQRYLPYFLELFQHLVGRMAPSEITMRPNKSVRVPVLQLVVCFNTTILDRHVVVQGAFPQTINKSDNKNNNMPSLP
jgi:hypothetical protein